MKRLLAPLCLLLCLGACDLFGGGDSEEEYFFYNGEERLPLDRTKDHLTIAFADTLTRAEIDSVFQRYALKPVLTYSDFEFIVQMPDRTDARRHYTTYGNVALPALGNEPIVRYALPAFRIGQGTLVGLTDQMVCQLSEGAAVESIKTTYRLTEDEIDWMVGAYLFLVTKQSPHDPLTLANLLHERPDVDFCIPSFLSSHELWPYRTSTGSRW